MPYIVYFHRGDGWITAQKSFQSLDKANKWGMDNIFETMHHIGLVDTIRTGISKTSVAETFVFYKDELSKQDKVDIRRMNKIHKEIYAH